MGVGNFEAGGGGPVDFWRARLSGGDRVELNLDASGGCTWEAQLFAPGTTDGTFGSAVPLSGGNAGQCGTRGVIDLRAPYTGNFVLAVCERDSYGISCPSVDSGEGQDPMDPYTFTTRQTGGLESRTSLRLSAATVTYGHEKSLKLTAKVAGLYGGTGTGTVTFSDGKAAVCRAKLVKGIASCSPASGTAIRAGSTRSPPPTAAATCTPPNPGPSLLP